MVTLSLSLGTICLTMAFCAIGDSFNGVSNRRASRKEGMSRLLFFGTLDDIVKCSKRSHTGPAVYFPLITARALSESERGRLESRWIEPTRFSIAFLRQFLTFTTAKISFYLSLCCNESSDVSMRSSFVAKVASTRWVKLRSGSRRPKHPVNNLIQQDCECRKAQL
jgi:hypothetical protein